MTLRPALAALCTIAATLLPSFLPRTHAAGGEWFEFADSALEKFDFEGMTFPADVAQLKEQFPGIQKDTRAFDAEVGLECYEATDLENADRARFYFCDGRMYQVEIYYDLPRVRKMGGMQALVRKLIDTWGHADHIGEGRWTWLRLKYNRRADFYNWPDSAQLTITDVNAMPVVALRQQRLEKKRPPSLGF